MQPERAHIASQPLILIRVELVKIVFLKVAPAIIRRAVGLYGERRLVLVEQHLYEHVFVVAVAAIEHQLYVCAHREHLIVDPSFALKTVEVDI